MNHSEFSRFEMLVRNLFEAVRPVLYVDKVEVVDDGAIWMGKLSGASGVIEVLFGPPEFHVEVFITLSATQKRYDLAAMMVVPCVRDWMERNKPTGDQEQLLEEFKWIEKLLLNGLKDKEVFSTLYYVGQKRSELNP